jgi:hypothetical protein
MKLISIEGTKLTPSVKMDAAKGQIEIEGNSIADDAANFYKPIMEFIHHYILQPKPKTVINIKLQYITMPSSKSILEILKTLEHIHKKGESKVAVNWHYSVDEMLNAGKDFQTVLKIPFNMIEV